MLPADPVAVPDPAAAIERTLLGLRERDLREDEMLPRADEALAALDALLVERQRWESARIMAGSELDWLIVHLSETDEHAAVHARRARAALVAVDKEEK